jgi:hypothetical protein
VIEEEEICTIIEENVFLSSSGLLPSPISLFSYRVYVLSKIKEEEGTQKDN